MINRLIFYDSESTINGGPKHGPHPMHPANKMVMTGLISWQPDVHNNIDEVHVYDSQSEVEEFWRRFYSIASTNTHRDDIRFTIVGHNIGFDLKLAGPLAMKVLALPNVYVWDTMVADYVINGQDNTLRYTLEAVAERHGIEFKKDEDIKAFFLSGRGADHVEPGKLREYLKGDVLVLPSLMASQMQKIREQEQERVVTMRMDAQKALTLAEYNGMSFDAKIIMDAMPELTKEMEVLKAGLQVTSAGVKMDLTSPSQLAKWLYGGVVEITENVPVGLYKNGKVKYKNQTREIVIPAHYGKPHISSSTDEDTLRSLEPAACTPIVNLVVEAVLKYRNLSKEVSTYCTNLLELDIDGFIYGNINTCVTVTGRLSSSKPNLQNVKNGKLKAAFRSRYSDGVLIEVDYNQLEIVALAALSQDAQLLDDIEHGVDIHTALFYDMWGRKPSKEERKAFKPRTFALVYGATANGIATNAKCSNSEAVRFIDAFYDRYPGVKLWHKLLKNEWMGQSKPVPGQYPKAMFKHRSPTGLLLTYYTGDRNTFSPTQMVNYPVQSFAADIVQLMVSKVDRVLRNFPGALLVNVVHDSFLIDCPGCRKDEVVRAIRALLSRTPEFVEKELGVKMGVKEMSVGISTGRDWADMEEVT